MTKIHKLFIQNLRFFRSQRQISQIQLSEMVNISPNYLNAVENGKNFPSLEVLQRIIDVLDILPHQLFLEYPNIFKTTNQEEIYVLFQELSYLKQSVNNEFDKTIQKYSGNDFLKFNKIELSN